MAVFNTLSSASEVLLNDPVKDWKNEGKKVMGYYCPYVPEEIFVAAGMIPFSIRATGSTSSELGDNYAHSATCSFIRHILDHGLRGEYRFLDGFVAITCCDPFRRMFDMWRKDVVTNPKSSLFLQILSIPFKMDERCVQLLQKEFQSLRNNMELFYKIKISDDDLRSAIKICNETKKLLKELYELRKRPDPPISGADTLKIVIAANSMPKENFNALLKEFLSELKEKKGGRDYRARLLLAGSVLDNPSFIEIIEGMGGIVVADYLCNGIMYFHELADESLPPMEALARRSLKHPSCPRMFGNHLQRFETILGLMKEYKADGLITQRQMFCDIWGGEVTMLRWNIKQAGLPILSLEREYSLSGAGQLRTRVQAFLETIEGGV